MPDDNPNTTGFRYVSYQPCKPHTAHPILPSPPSQPLLKHKSQISSHKRKKILAPLQQVLPILAFSKPDVELAHEQADDGSEFHEREIAADAAEGAEGEGCEGGAVDD